MADGNFTRYNRKRMKMLLHAFFFFAEVQVQSKTDKEHAKRSWNLGPAEKKQKKSLH